MLRRILSLHSEPIITGSFWLTVGGLIASFGNYLFNLIMGRYLNPSEYGTLMSLVSLSIIVSLPSAIITTVVTKFVANFNARGEELKISRLIVVLTKYSLIIVCSIILIFIILTPTIQKFLNISDKTVVYVTGFMVSLGLVSSINLGVYRGLLLFKLLSIFGIITVLVKLTVGWYLVNINLLVMGGLIAILFSTLLPWLLSFFPLRKYFTVQNKQNFGLKKKLISFSLPTFFITTATTLFFYSDLLLVKHFFSSDEAGIYAAASIIGKAIFFAVGPIANVLFPIIAHSYASGKSIRREILLSIILTMLPALGALFFYNFFTSFVLTIFFPHIGYEGARTLIPYYGLMMVLYAGVYLFIQVFLAIEEKTVPVISLIIALLQILLISIFHSSLIQILIISIVLFSLFFAYQVFRIMQLITNRNERT